MRKVYTIISFSSGYFDVEEKAFDTKEAAEMYKDELDKADSENWYTVYESDLEEKPEHWIECQEQRMFGLMNVLKCPVCGKSKLKGAVEAPKYCENCGKRLTRADADCVN